MSTRDGVVELRGKNPRINPVWMIFAVGMLPVLVAAYMFFSGNFIPAGQKNRGELLTPPLALAQWSLRDAQGMALVADRWLILVMGGGQCGEHCMRALHESRQVNIALGREAHRVARYYVATQPVSNELQVRLKRDYPDMGQVFMAPAGWGIDRAGGPDAQLAIEQNYIFVVDPLGNIIMYYSPEHQGKDLLEDLKWLLRLSNIG